MSDPLDAARAVIERAEDLLVELRRVRVTLEQAPASDETARLVFIGRCSPYVSAGFWRRSLPWSPT